MNAATSRNKSLLNFVLLLFGLSIPLWVIGSIFDVQLFPGFKLFQLPLAMPAVAALILIYRESGRAGIVALLKRTYDLRRITSTAWYLPVLLILPSINLLEYWIVRISGTSVPSPRFSLAILLGYSTVFLMTYGEELGLTGYAIDPMQQRYTALKSGLLIGLLQAAYHIPGFIISGYYSFEWIFWHVIYTIVLRVLFVWIYNNSGKSLFSMALSHWTFGLFWILFPQPGNLQKALPFDDPRLAAFIAIAYVAVVTFLWGPKTLAQFRFARSDESKAAETHQPATAGQ